MNIKDNDDLKEIEKVVEQLREEHYADPLYGVKRIKRVAERIIESESTSKSTKE